MTLDRPGRELVQGLRFGGDMTADDFCRQAAMAMRIDNLAHKLTPEAVTTAVACWGPGSHQMLERLSYRNQAGAWVIRRMAVQCVDGLVRIADLPED